MGRPPKITGALREELWRRYRAGETILGSDARLTSVRRRFTACCRRPAALLLPTGVALQESSVSVSVKRFREVSPRVTPSAHR